MGRALSAGRGSVIDLTLQNDRSATRKVRAAVDRIADECRLEEEARFDLKVAATEAVTNALRAGADDASVEVKIACSDESVDIEVSAPAAFPAAWSAGDRRLESEGGRGIPIMIALVDEVEFARTARGTRVRMRKQVAPAGEGHSAFGNGDPAYA